MDKNFSIEVNKQIYVTSKATITIDETQYRLTKSIDGKLTINKHNIDGSTMIVFPRVSNEVDVQ